jgi:predicted nucleic acid-binding protein
MSQFVVDASVVLTWCFPDENSAFAGKIALRFQQGDSAIAPAFWAHEVLNALLVGEKRKRISRQLSKNFLSDLESMPIEMQSFPAEAVFGRIQELSRQHGLTAYDAAYLHLAEVNRLPLATLDEKLIEACQRSNVDLFG